MAKINILVLLGVLLTTPTCILTEASKDNPRLNAWIKDCQEKAGASEQDYQTVKMRKMPSTPEGVCMVQCIFSKLHIIDNGKFNKRGFVITFSPIVKGDFRKLIVLKDIASACDKEVAETIFDEKCGTTKKILECFGRQKNLLNLN